MRISFFQAGARHNFFLPRMFHQHGVLQRFYGDLVFPEGSWQARQIRRFSGNRVARTLARRIVEAVPPQLISSHYRSLLAPSLWRDLASGEFRSRYAIPWRIEPEDRASTDIVYSTYFDVRPSLDQFVPGTRVVSDVILVPSALKIGNREAREFPQWGEVPVPDSDVAAHDELVRDMLARSDRLVCPSRAVIDDVASYGEEFRAKCRLSPYGGTVTFSGKPAAVPKRVLFAGAVLLRKGPQYLAQAARQVGKVDPDVRFVIAGSVSPTARAQLAADNVEVLGHLSRLDMQREFEKADLLLLPSLAEGAAGVVLEGLAAGLPVVATRAAGVDFGTEAGIVVPERDARAIADAVLAICSDRPLRERMSRAAIEWSSHNSNAAWGDRLMAIMRELHGAGR